MTHENEDTFRITFNFHLCHLLNAFFFLFTVHGKQHLGAICEILLVGIILIFSWSI